MHTNMDVDSNPPHNITVDASIWTQIQNDNATLKNMLQESSLPKKPIKVTKEVAKISVKIHKSPPITICGVNDFKQLMINLKLEEAEGHEQQMKTLANGEIKILTSNEHQFRRTIKVLEEQKVKKPIYWPTDPNKLPDVIDIFVMKGISSNYTEVEGLLEHTSDHIPVLLSLSSDVIMKQKKMSITNKKTNWNLFRNTLEENIILLTRLKTIADIKNAVKKITDDIVSAAEIATPVAVNDKTEWNRVSKILHDKIKEMKNETFKSYLSSLTVADNTDYSLWKASRLMKRPHVQIQSFRKEDSTWARSEQEKAEMYARHFEHVFMPNTIDSEFDILQCQPLNSAREIKHFSPLEIAKEIDNNIKPKKSPGN
ncbi:hypothetical protein QTP88_015330 [Uroleucon formosanum]